MDTEMNLKITGVVLVRMPGPVTDIGTGLQSAVWPGDNIRVLARVGSRRRCRVTYRHGEYVSSFTALVPKRWLRYTNDASK